jgi:hypothetical protein
MPSPGGLLPSEKSLRLPSASSFLARLPAVTLSQAPNILADRGYRGLARLAARKNIKLDIKARLPGTKGRRPVRAAASRVETGLPYRDLGGCARRLTATHPTIVSAVIERATVRTYPNVGRGSEERPAMAAARTREVTTPATAPCLTFNARIGAISSLPGPP